MAGRQYLPQVSHKIALMDLCGLIYEDAAPAPKDRSPVDRPLCSMETNGDVKNNCKSRAVLAGTAWYGTPPGVEETSNQ
jgi:hypothetical protein